MLVEGLYLKFRKVPLAAFNYIRKFQDFAQFGPITCTQTVQIKANFNEKDHT